MLNELDRPSLKVTLDVDIPEMKPIKHELDKVEEFAKQLDEFYRNAIETTDDIDIKIVKQERTKVRKVIKTISDNRKAMVKAYKEPIKDFEDTSKRIEKILKGTDDMMKELVDADKAAKEDPFAGLSVNENLYAIVFSTTEENKNKIVKYIRDLGIKVETREEK
jgi:prophage DNA circulation protein